MKPNQCRGASFFSAATYSLARAFSRGVENGTTMWVCSPARLQLPGPGAYERPRTVAATSDLSGGPVELGEPLFAVSIPPVGDLAHDAAPELSRAPNPFRVLTVGPVPGKPLVSFGSRDRHQGDAVELAQIHQQ